MTDPDLSRYYDKLLRNFVQGTPQMADIGVVVDTITRNRGLMTLPPRSDWLGDPGRDLMHPGVTTVLADSCCGLAVGASLDKPVTYATLDLRMDYLRPASPARPLHCEAHCHLRTRSIAFVRAEAWQDDPQQPVAMAQATFMMATPSRRRPQPDPAGTATTEPPAAGATNSTASAWQPPAASEPAMPPGEIPYLDYLGIRIAPDPVLPVFRLPFAPKLVGNPMLPALHGGVIAGFAETAAILHLNQTLRSEKLPKGIDFSLDYLRSAGPEETFASCEVVRRGSRVALVHVRLWQRDPDRPIAVARSHCLLTADS